jgi:hypothetical protein
MPSLPLKIADISFRFFHVTDTLIRFAITLDAAAFDADISSLPPRRCHTVFSLLLYFSA